MEKESTGERGMGVGYKGIQGLTKRTVQLQEEKESLQKNMFGKHAPSSTFMVTTYHNKEKAEGESLLRNSSVSAIYTQCSNNTGIIVN
jgi:hypothetical protein